MISNWSHLTTIRLRITGVSTVEADLFTSQVLKLLYTQVDMFRVLSYYCTFVQVTCIVIGYIYFLELFTLCELLWLQLDCSSQTSAELFKVQPSQPGSDKVRIVGFPPPLPPRIKWHLTVRENILGAPERFPRFMPDDSVCTICYVCVSIYANLKMSF